LQGGVRVIPEEKSIAGEGRFWLHRVVEFAGGSRSFCGLNAAKSPHAMSRIRMHVYYSGRVQGVGFRYTVKTVAMGFETTGVVRNLPDGRVELMAEGEREELEAFKEAIGDSGLAGFIREQTVDWLPATDEFRGFEIVR
jgi:acylphosphatase